MFKEKAILSKGQQEVENLKGDNFVRKQPKINIVKSYDAFLVAIIQIL